MIGFLMQQAQDGKLPANNELSRLAERQRVDNAKANGQVITGYKPVEVRVNANRNHSQSVKTEYQPIFADAPSAPAPAVAAPAPQVQAPKPKDPIKAPEVEYSPEIQQAKERVKTYEDDITSGKTSENIYDVGSNKFNKNSDPFLNSKQFDFSSTSFEATTSPKPTEQAQAAQNQLQNYLTKYSKYKSDN